MSYYTYELHKENSNIYIWTSFNFERFPMESVNCSSSILPHTYNEGTNYKNVCFYDEFKNTLDSMKFMIT